MRTIWVLISALGLGLAGRASAAPSLYGPTGDLVIPTADTLAARSWNVHAHALDTNGGTLTTFGANFGVTKAFEVGISGVNVRGLGTKALFNAKYAVLMETAKLPGLAVGGLDIGSQLGPDPGVYVVATKSLSSLLGGQLAKYNIRGHLGYGANSVFNDDIFGGLDVQLTNNIQGMVEWLNGSVFFGGRVGLGKGVRAEVGDYDGHVGGGISFGAALK